MARQPFVGRGGILLYHRVAELAHDPWSIAVTTAEFAAQLAVLQEHAVCLPLEAFLARRAAGTLPQNAVALTFDDGYADNLTAALPLLEAHGIPATLFVLSGFVGSNRETWWDRLQQAVLDTRDLPGELEIGIGGRKLTWKRPVDVTDAGMRRALHGQLHAAFAAVDTPAHEAAFAELMRKLTWQPQVRRSHRPLTHDELRELAASPLISIGAHTRSHPHLARLPPGRQQAELAGGKADLEALLDRPIDMLAYPHGSCDATTARLAREAGYRWGFNSVASIVPHRVDPLRIPRINVEGMNAESFERLLIGHGIRQRRHTN
ncbi:MAG: polysaccharide deacetylase family protein [Geminicoccaceae bacterium]